MFKTNPSRTWLTILGMGVGTGAVVALVGLGFGLQGIILNKIVLGDSLLSLNVSNPPSLLITLTPAAVQDFAQNKYAKDVSPLASLTALATYNGLTGNITLEGAKPSYFLYTGVQVVAGDLFTDQTAKADASKVVITSALLQLFGIPDAKDAIGKALTFHAFVPMVGTTQTVETALDKQYTIKGVIDDAGTLAAIMTADEFSSHFKVPYYDNVQVRVTNGAALTPMQDYIVAKGYSVTALSQTVDQANKIFYGIQVVLAIFGSIALTVSAIGMFNTMTVTLLERTAEIGVMRTIGASSRDIVILFIAEATIVGLLGGVVGILIGAGIGEILNGLLSIVADKFGGQSVTLFSYPLGFLLFIELFSGVVGFLTGLFPAQRAAKLNPLDAIRYK
jgi:putative ABC transport system permease protein